MTDKKKDLIPIAAIAIFLVIIIILCVVRLQARNSGREAQSEMLETVTETAKEESVLETVTVSDEETTADSTEESSEGNTIGAETALGENAETKESAQKDTQKDADGTKKPVSGRTISGNDPFAGAESVNKTNQEMLMEMAGYWEENNMEAVDDLAHLAWFMKMSASIVDTDTFYYYGERNADGQPQGVGIACYADNAYYYGEWAGGKREGTGEWVKFYVYYDDDTTSDRAYKLQMYMGEWANDMPNGEGHQHYDLDMSKAANKSRYLQNMIGTFKDGLYSGEMYMTTLNWDGNQEEWNGVADNGIWSPYGAATNKKEVPICQDVDDEDNYLWLAVSQNKDRGIAELMP